MRHRTLLLSAVILAVPACRGGGHHQAAPAAAAAAPAPAPMASMTQADLARDLDDADREGTWADVKARWQGQVLRWTVHRARALCRREGACNLVPFAVQQAAPAGWLPSVTFAPGQFAALEARCGDRDPCEVTIEGTLAKLDVSGDTPTNLEIVAATLIDPHG